MSDYNVIHHLEFPNDMNRRHKHVHVADEEVVSDENSDMNMIGERKQIHIHVYQ